MRRIKTALIICGLVLNTPCFSVNETNTASLQTTACTEGKLCFAQELVTEVLKEAVTVVGKHLVDKYMEKQQAVEKAPVQPAPAPVAPAREAVTATVTASVDDEEEVIIID